ncbi:MAG TPA: glucosamine-6-phosphate deaminase [Rhodothermales bacterium]|nr:glucosamine-6-phosphate deaminase [Rhodothermales bacterium]
MAKPTATSRLAVTLGIGLLEVNVYPDRESLGRAAAEAVAAQMDALLRTREEVRMVFAAAPSQEEFLAALRARTDLDWARVRAFHMDEYLGLPPDAPQLFGAFLRERLFGRLPFKAVHYLDPSPHDPLAECARYAALLQLAPPDLVCLGIGENGHLAFNDPPVADFHDAELVKVVTLDEACRRQQVNDGCFQELESVPRRAVTLTIPALLRGRYLSVVVPGPSKAPAVRAALYDPISTRCPATVLRLHERAVLNLDLASARLAWGFDLAAGGAGKGSPVRERRDPKSFS